MSRKYVKRLATAIRSKVIYGSLSALQYSLDLYVMYIIAYVQPTRHDHDHLIIHVGRFLHELMHSTA